MRVKAFAHTIVDLSPYGKVVDITIKGDPEQVNKHTTIN